jgi:uncharacterized protein
MGPLRSALFAGHVMHQRTRPKRHRLRYRVFYLAIDLDEAPTFAERLRLLSFNRFNLFSVYERDYGDKRDGPLQDQIRRKLQAADLETNGAIILMTMPRMLGYAFNPLSVYFCHRRDGGLAAILYEVNNTFGQRHSYLIPAVPDAEGLVRQESAKSLYVSPFLDTDLRYDFVVRPSEERVGVSVTASDSSGPILFAKLSASRRPLTDLALARTFVSYPLLTLRVVVGIHWEALRLFLKGVRLTARPVQTTGGTTLGRATSNAPNVTEDARVV